MGAMNLERASWARKALDTFAKETGQTREPLAEALGDLMCNLLHLARTQGFDPVELHDTARATFEAEEHDDE